MAARPQGDAEGLAGEEGGTANAASAVFSHYVCRCPLMPATARDHPGDISEAASLR